MPIGLCKAIVTFQRLMAHALTSVTKKYGNLVRCYVDDVVIATPTLNYQIERLDELLTCMKRAGKNASRRSVRFSWIRSNIWGGWWTNMALDQIQTR